MNELIDPPVSAELDVRKFPYMPLHVAKLINSDFRWVVTDAEFRAAVLLWVSAWHQVPAGSLPNNDRTLAAMVGCSRNDAGLAEWMAMKTGALYGFKLATDGRYYHPVIVEAALDADKRIKRTAAQREASVERMRKSRTRKKGDGDQGVADDARTMRATFADDARLNRNEMKGSEGNKGLDRSERKSTTTASSLRDDGAGDASGLADLERRTGGDSLFPDLPETAPPKKPKAKAAKGRRDKAEPEAPEAFARFWAAYPRKVGKIGIGPHWNAAIAKAGGPDPIIAGSEAFAALCRKRGTPTEKIPHPQTWLNAGRWADEELTQSPEKAAAEVLPIGQRKGNRMALG